MTESATPVTRGAQPNIQAAIARGLAAAEAASTAAPETAAAVTDAPAVVATETAAPEAKSVLKKLPPREVKPLRPAEHILARRSAREGKNAAQAQQAQLETELASAREVASASRAKLDKINAAFEAGDADEVVKLVGYENVDAFQKQWLEKRGAVPKTDPRIAELERIAKEAHDKLSARERAENEAREAQEIAALQEEDFRGIQQQLRDSGYEHLPQLAEKPYFVRAVQQSMYQNPKLDDEEHWSRAFEAHQDWYNDLHSVFGGAKPAEPAAAPAGKRAAVAPATQLTAPTLPDVRVPGVMNSEKPVPKRSMKELNDSRNASIQALLAKLPA